MMKYSNPVLVTAVVCTVIWVNAGSLTPPAGPVAPTMKTLVEVEPRIAINATNTPGDVDSLFKITAPGSYYLTGNVSGGVGRMGIEVAATGGVTIDLMGYELVGIAGTLDGIRVTVPLATFLTVRNGTVRTWAQDGVDALSAVTTTLEHVVVSGNTMIGINLGPRSNVTECISHGNGDKGIVVGTNSIVAQSTASDNGGDGINAGLRSTVKGCVSNDNGSDGILAQNRSSVTDCSTTGNNNSGILVDIGDGTVTNCTANSNGDDGIFVSSGCTVTGCTANDNGGNGIDANGQSTISHCTVSGNTAEGIEASAGSNVIGCTASQNGQDGIHIAGNGSVINCTCDLNGTAVATGAGVRAAGFGNRVDGNHATDNDIGIAATAINNIIIRNTVGGNTTEFDVPTSAIGQVLDVTAGGDITTTNPWRNFIIK